MPIMGKIQLNGLTLNAARAVIETEARKYIKVFQLYLKLADYRFSIIGEVHKPGLYYMNQNRVSIIEALALAGDFTDLANKNIVKLVRQGKTGSTVHTIDFTKIDLLNSEFFYLKSKDILYVQPVKIRSVGSLTNGQSSITFFITATSSLLILLNTYLLITK
jgi:polysaccharide export outer membrane protein